MRQAYGEGVSTFLGKDQSEIKDKKEPVKVDDNTVKQIDITPVITSRKTVDKLLIIYKDGTFENFYPAG